MSKTADVTRGYLAAKSTCFPDRDKNNFHVLAIWLALVTRPALATRPLLDLNNAGHAQAMKDWAGGLGITEACLDEILKLVRGQPNAIGTLSDAALIFQTAISSGYCSGACPLPADLGKIYPL